MPAYMYGTGHLCFLC